MKHVLGIDPGINGALVLVAASRAGDERVVSVHDMPFVTVLVGRKQRKRIDVAKLVTFFQCLVNTMPIDAIWIEDVHAMPNEGAVGAFSFGRSVGLVEATAHACGIAPRFVAPARWKGALHCPADKTRAREYATRLLPDAWHYWRRVKDDGRAEAALIACYGLAMVHERVNVQW